MFDRMALFFWPSERVENKTEKTTNPQNPTETIDNCIDNPDYNAAINLLKLVKLIDNSDKPAIDPETQIMIKKELLSLPNACKDLLFYRKLIDKGIQEKGETAVHFYGNIAWAEMRKHIHAIKDTPLPWGGSKMKFVPC